MNDLKSHFSQKRIIVTGATGFIGAHLCHTLAHLGANVIAFVRKESDTWRLKPVLNKIKVVEVDLQEYSEVKKSIVDSEPDLIFHFAIPPHALLRDDHDLQLQIAITNSHLENLYRSIHDQGIQVDSFIHACSGSIYDWNEDNFILSEKTVLNPNTLRGRLKLSQRNTCLSLANQYGIPTKLARIFRAYGPMEVNTKLIVKALECLDLNKAIMLGSDTYKRDYIYVKDLIGGLLLLAKKESKEVLEINFGSQEQYSAQEVIEQLEKLLNHEIPKQINAYPKNAYDQGNFVADCAEAKRVLDWEPMTSFKDGLLETINWYQKAKL